VEYLNSRLQPGSLVFARSELYFGLRCRDCLRDDPNLGFYSGRHADYIVLEPDYDGMLLRLRQTKPDVYHMIRQRLDNGYREVFRNANYRVLQAQ
jgi:hypothetical protein